MKTYSDMVDEYGKKKKDTLADSINAALTYTDEVCVETGVLEEAGLLHELTEGVCGALPFVFIAVTEGSKVILKRKPCKTGLKDSAWRMAKTGLAMGVGSAVIAAGAPLWAGIPATLGVRAACDKYRSSLLTGHRVKGRIERIRALRKDLEKAGQPTGEAVSEPLEDAVQHIIPMDGEALTE